MLFRNIDTLCSQCCVNLLTMVHVCVVPGCSNRSDRETHLSFHCLPLKNKKLLKVWIHKIGRKNLLNNNSRVCSTHFSNAVNRVLRPDEVPTINLPNVTTPVRKRKSPVKRLFIDSGVENENSAVTVSVRRLPHPLIQYMQLHKHWILSTAMLSYKTKLLYYGKK